MRIHIVTDRFTLGGGIEHIYQITRGLKEYTFAIFAKSGSAEHKFRDLENVQVYPGDHSLRDMLAGQPDLVHIHHLRPLLNFFKNPFMRHEIPIVFTAHGLHIHKYEFYASLSNKFKYFLRFFLEKIILKKPDRVIAVSKEDREFLEKNYCLKNVQYLTNGIDFAPIRRITMSKKELRERLNLPTDRFLCTTVARFDYQKGYDILIDAIANLKEMLTREVEPPHFLFVGNGSEFEKMKDKSRDLALAAYITFLGERKDVYDIVKASDLFILPSRWEGLPIVLLETGLLQTPVLASETYGNREILKGDRGILFRNQDVDNLAGKIKDILTGKYKLPFYALNLYREVENDYNLEKMIDGLRMIYSSYGK